MNANPGTLHETMTMIRGLLDAGRIDDAMHLIRQSGIASNELRNAMGVCLLRRGQYDKAIELYRLLVLNNGAVTIKNGVPDTYRCNFATALLLSGNIHGCVTMLADVRDGGHPGAVRLRAAVERWKESLTRWQRWRFALGSTTINVPVVLDYAPGELTHPAAPKEAPSQAA